LTGFVHIYAMNNNLFASTAKFPSPFVECGFEEVFRGTT
jgi:hypothetical protein